MRSSVTGEASLFRYAAASYPGRQPGRGLGGVVLHDGRDLHDEARAHRLVILHADVRAVLGDDVAHNGESQARAAILGRKIGQKKLLLVLGSDAAAATRPAHAPR